MNRLVLLAGASLLSSAVALAQAQQRQASIRGGGSPDQGKCTIEVVVDGAAEVQIQGATATLRTISGQPAQWRRFECSSAMPPNPANFRFSGVDGRGRQQLARDPGNGGVAVVRIEDPDNGSEGYTFDITWGRDQGRDQGYSQRPGEAQQRGAQGQPYYPGQAGDQGRGDGYRDYPEDRYRQNRQDSDYYRRYGHGFAIEDAVDVCRREVVRQASARFRSGDIHIRRMEIDDQPGRNDWVLGSLDVHWGPRHERYNFSCSVNFENGRVRSAQIEQRAIGR